MHFWIISKAYTVMILTIMSYIGLVICTMSAVLLQSSLWVSMLMREKKSKTFLPFVNSLAIHLSAMIKNSSLKKCFVMILIITSGVSYLLKERQSGIYILYLNWEQAVILIFFLKRKIITIFLNIIKIKIMS